MSDLSNEISSPFTQTSCECYKKLSTYGIPLRISDENDLYTENQRKLYYEKAFELPGILKINEDIKDYLIVEDNDLHNVFLFFAEVIPKLADFEVNVLSFWILDVFIEGLWTAQNIKMDFNHQKATLLWIAYCFNYIQKENPTRKEFFNHLKTILLQIPCKINTDYDETIGESTHKILINPKFELNDIAEKKIWNLPLPPDYNKKENSISEANMTSSEGGTSSAIESVESIESMESKESTKSSSFEELENKPPENGSATNVMHMKIILEILYRIFGRVWVYLEIQTVFHAMPPTKQVDLPFQLKTPKPLLQPDSSFFKGEKSGRRLSTSERSSEEVDPEKELHKNDFILPLQVAEESKALFKQFFSLPGSQRSVFGRRKS